MGLTFTSAVRKLTHWQQMRRENWEHGLTLSDSGTLIWRQCRSNPNLKPDDIVEKDWIVEPKGMSFNRIYQHLKAGSIVRRGNWDEEKYCMFDDDGSLIDQDTQPLALTIADMESHDWLLSA